MNWFGIDVHGFGYADRCDDSMLCPECEADIRIVETTGMYAYVCNECDFQSGWFIDEDMKSYLLDTTDEEYDWLSEIEGLPKYKS